MVGASNQMTEAKVWEGWDVALDMVKSFREIRCIYAFQRTKNTGSRRVWKGSCLSSLLADTPTTMKM